MPIQLPDDPLTLEYVLAFVITPVVTVAWGWRRDSHMPGYQDD